MARNLTIKVFFIPIHLIKLFVFLNQPNLLTMRKINLFVGLLLITGMGFITSCSKDSTTDVSPSIVFKGGVDFIASDVTLDAGSSFHVGITAAANSTSGKNLTKFKVVRTFNNTPTTELDTTINTANFSWEAYYSTNTSAGTERWTFTITDKDGQTNELAFVITTEATAGEIYTYTAVLLAGQLNPDGGSFYSTLNDSVMKKGIANVNQSRIDMIYYYGITNYASIVAPASTQLSEIPAFSYILDATNADHWTVTNQTKFRLVTGIEWALVTNDALITSNAIALHDMNINLLSENQIIAFETASTSANPGKKGLFKVIALNGNSGADRSITIEVKIQK